MMRFLLRHGAVRLIGGRAIPALMLIDLAMLANRARRNPIVDRNLRRGAAAEARARVAAMSDRSGEWAARRRAWETERLNPARERAPERKGSFSTISDMPIDPLYGPWSASETDALETVGLPG